jgi:hypothetical protein
LVIFYIELSSITAIALNFRTFLVADITKCFSSVMIFVILLVNRKDIKVLSKLNESVRLAFENANFSGKFSNI